jgi:ring-1,2-phenylacetyl-CoA epoxidase subunit PaaD
VPGEPPADPIWRALAEIEDPELPIAITDLGLVHAAALEDRTARVELVPTFTGCPALDVIRERVHRRLLEIPGVDRAEVVFVFEPRWTIDRMSATGRARLQQHGVSVAAAGGAGLVTCPVCGSTNTTLDNPFGPTLCRAIYYCRDCRNPIERFKSPEDAPARS